MSLRGPRLKRKPAFHAPADIEKLSIEGQIGAAFGRAGDIHLGSPQPGKVRMPVDRPRRGCGKIRLAVGQAGNSGCRMIHPLRWSNHGNEQTQKAPAHTTSLPGAKCPSRFRGKYNPAVPYRRRWVA